MADGEVNQRAIGETQVRIEGQTFSTTVDSQGFRQHILEHGMTPVIPPRSNRKQPCDYDAHLYREMMALRRCWVCILDSSHRRGRCWV